jgi:RNA polymerase sigma-70 factor (ECF subfamily)
VRTNAATAAAPRDTAARLFEQYGPQLYRFCLGRLRSPEEAEDAVQSTFLRVYKALGKGTAPEYEAAWLYKIAHNVCLSRHEVVGRRRAFETPTDLDEIEYALAAPETRREELAGLSDALAEMPVNLRQAILLREWQGLSYAEIAVAMDTTVSAVETLIFRARKHLAGALEPEERKPTKIAGLLAGLLGWSRNLLSAAGPAKVAAGAALLAVGAAGVGTAVELQNGHAAKAPKPPASPVATSTPLAHATAVPAAPRSASRAAKVTFTSSVAAAPLTAPTPTAAPSDSATGTTPSVPTPTPVPTVQAPVATAPALPEAPLPGVTTPTPPAAPPLTPPTVQTPTVTLPAVPALPTVTLPVSLPGP